MTTTERAEKIVEMIDSGNFEPSTLVQDIAAQIEAYHADMVSAALSNGTLWTQEDVRTAIEEAERAAVGGWTVEAVADQAYTKGFNAAKEKAAEIAKNEQLMPGLAKRIRSMNPEEK